MPEEKHPLKVFLCHAHSDREKVRALYSRLKREGVDVWLDKENLLPGSDWEYEIRRAVRNADVVVVCLSKQFNQAGFRQKEVRLALDTAMEKPEGEIFIIPARLEECDTLESLRKWHWVDLFEEDGYQRLIRALRVRADKIGATLRIRRGGESVSPKIEKPIEEKKPPTPTELQTRDISIGHDVSGSVIVAGNNNVINLNDNKKATQMVPENGLAGAKQERVLEAAIEKEVRVTAPASLFVWIRRQESKNIISVISSVNEDVTLDEESVKAKGLEIEFPIENGKVLPAGIILRLVAPDFNPSTQFKKINVPPEGDSEVCEFIVTPMKAGKLLLSLEVLKDEVSLATRTLHTIALETQKKEGGSLVIVSIPIIVFVQTSTSGVNLLEERRVKEKIETEHASLEKIALEKAKRELEERIAREKAERDSAEKSTREKERLEKHLAQQEKSVREEWASPILVAPKSEKFYQKIQGDKEHILKMKIGKFLLALLVATIAGLMSNIVADYVAPSFENRHWLAILIFIICVIVGAVISLQDKSNANINPQMEQENMQPETNNANNSRDVPSDKEQQEPKTQKKKSKIDADLIKKLVQHDQLDKAVATLIEKGCENAVILDQRLSNLKRREILGTISRENVNAERTTIAHDIIEIIKSGEC